MTFTKPVGVEFKLDPTITDPEKAFYRRAKSTVQNHITSNFIRMQWEVEVPPLKDMEPLKDRITKRGFSVVDLREGSKKSTWDTTQHKISLAVSLPKTPQEESEDGYFSDGWEKEFRASVIHKKIQGINEEKYKALLSSITKSLNQQPAVNKITFEISEHHLPVVLEWVKDDLVKLGYQVAIEKGAKTLDKPERWTYYYYLICVNPLMKNTLKVTYEI